MEEPTDGIQATLEQPGTDAPVITKKGRIKPMATAVQEQNGSTSTQEGGKPKRERQIGLLPEPTKEQMEIKLTGKIIQETTWASLKGRKLFSMNPDGSHPYLKLSKSSYYDLVTEEVATNIPINTAQKVYRIKLL